MEGYLYYAERVFFKGLDRISKGAGTVGFVIYEVGFGAVMVISCGASLAP